MHTTKPAVEAELLAYIPALHHFARRFYKSRHDSDDLVQDTLIKAISNLDRFEEGTRLKSWLFTIMRNTYYTRYAKSRREHVGISDEMMVMMPVAAGQEWAWRAQELEGAFLALTPLYRQALHMIAIEGISYEDAADRCARFELSRRLDS